MNDVKAIRSRAEDVADAAQIRDAEARVEAGEDEYVPIAFAQRLMAARSGAGLAPTSWPERALARSRARVSAAYLSQIETGKKPGSFDAMAKLARALGVDLGDLSRRDHDPREAGSPDGDTFSPAARDQAGGSIWCTQFQRIVYIGQTKEEERAVRYVSATEAKQALAAVLDAAQREPVVIRRQQRDVAVVLSMQDYERLTALNVEEFQRFCDRIGEQAKARGLTEEKLAEILASDV